MKSFRVTDGDLDLAHSRKVDMVKGRDKLVQDLTLWLLEPLGSGFTTPGFGSTLNSMMARDNTGQQQGQFIGRAMNERLLLDVEAEIDRVLNLYQQDQIGKIRQAQIQGFLSLYSKKEVLNSVDSIQATTDGTRMIVRANISTGDNEEMTVVTDVGIDQTNIAAL